MTITPRIFSICAKAGMLASTKEFSISGQEGDYQIWVIAFGQDWIEKFKTSKEIENYFKTEWELSEEDVQEVLYNEKYE